MVGKMTIQAYGYCVIVARLGCKGCNQKLCLDFTLFSLRSLYFHRL